MKKRPKFAKFLALAFAAVLAVAASCLLPIQAHAAEASNASSTDKPLLLALGDSITYGYEPDPDNPLNPDGKRLTDECFVSILANEKGYTYQNEGVIGNTAAGVLEKLQSGSLDDSIKQAEVITLTCGGNDLMKVMYQRTADYYNKQFSPKTPLTADDVVNSLWIGGTDTESIKIMLCAGIVLMFNYYDGYYIEDCSAFKEGLESFIENLNSVTSYIKSVNPDVQIYVATQYNPYAHFKDTYELVGTHLGACAAQLREKVIANAETGDYTVVDVYSAFAGNTATLCNATEDPLTLDFHPSVAGHKVIAETFAATVPTAATVAAADATKVYGEVDPELTATVSGVSDGDELDYAVTREAGENVGTYAVTPSGEKLQNGYLVSYESATLTVTAKSIVPGDASGITVEAPKDVAANGSEQRCAASLYDTRTDKALVEGTDYTLSYEGDLVNPGTVTMIVTGIGNYQGSFELTYKILEAVTPKSDTSNKSGDNAATPQTSDASAPAALLAVAGLAVCAAGLLRRAQIRI